MITFFLGKSNTGKSEKAEEFVLSLGSVQRVYIATMKVMDEAGKERVLKHRKQREGMGFETLEIPIKITEALSSIDNLKNTTVLLECISNLVGNEMHDNPDRAGLSEEEFANQIVKDVRQLSDKVSDLVVVSSEYEAKADYSEETLKYISYLNRTNMELKVVADRVFEVK